MIKPAATAAASASVLSLGTQAAPAEDAAVSGDFAALLESTLATGQDGVAGPTGEIDPAILLKLRQATGSALPPGALDLAALPDADGNAKDAAEDAPGNGAELAMPATPAEIGLSGLVLPGTVQPPQPPTLPVPQSTANLIEAAAAQATRKPLPAAAGQVTLEAGSAAGKADKSDAETATASRRAAALAETALVAPGQRAVLGTAAASANAQPAGDARRAATAQVQLATAIAQTAPRPDAAKPGSPAAAAAIQSAVTAKVERGAADDAAGAAPAITARITIPDRPSAAAEGAAAAPKASADQLAARAMAPETQASATPASAPSKAEPAATASVRAGMPRDPAAATTHQPVMPASVEAPATDTSAAIDPLATTTRPATAATPQQSVAIADAQPAPPTSSAAPPVQAAGAAPTGHDFAALVDRLVDARQAAVPEAVHAAISHSDFGQVSLRFNQDASGLSVAMSSADPEFARAVQASTASAQSQTASDNGSNAARQDGSGQQQQAAAGQAQSQNQSQAQASARDERGAQTKAEGRSGRAGDERQDNDPAHTGGGIYA